MAKFGSKGTRVSKSKAGDSSARDPGASRRRFRWILPMAVGAIVALTVAGIAACAPQTQSKEEAQNASYESKLDVTTADPTKVVTAEQWSNIYPDEYNTMMLNSEDDELVSYLEKDPYLTTIYEGTPFSKDYAKARGHYYAITDVQATKRISDKSKAVCYACKGSYYPSNENAGNTSIYTEKFSEVPDSELQNISCYDCHLNNPASATSSRAFFTEAFPNATIDWGASAAACGQCHNEYYFDQTTGAVTVPAGITDPGEMLDYYNSINFVDYTNPSTGVKQLKAQHPEVQMFADSVHQQEGLTCADCHMERLTDENGNEYTSHEIVNPTESETIRTTVCAKCHSNANDGGLMERLNSVTSSVEAREDEVGEELKDLTEKLTAAVSSGQYTDEELDQVRSLNRDAQWYWDFEYVENSSGYHNHSKATSCLDKAEDLTQQAIALLNK